ncbi:MAG: gliding motility-associated C-terminal domain-containing protein [Cytophagaceae bacterium]
MKNRLIVIICTIFLPTLLFAEGTKELRPQSAHHGGLLLMPSYSMFAIEGAEPKNQLKIKIVSTTERIYLGFNNRNGVDLLGNHNDYGIFVPGVNYKITSPSGVVVFESEIPASGPGSIGSWAAAVAGPQQLGNPTGYDAVVATPIDTGDYVISFTLPSDVVRLILHLFDITVAGSNNQPILGRLHSQGWQISTRSYSNPFMGKVYPYDGGSAVYEVDFNGMQPWVFVINFNTFGTRKTGDFRMDRRSIVGKADIDDGLGEFEVFLNPPDETLYPTRKKTLSLTGNVIRKDCVGSDFCLDFTANSEGDLHGFIDFNSNNVYEPALGEIYFEDRFTAPGTLCVPWNGRDAFGNIVTGNFQVSASLKFGMTHLPLYDVEHNERGYKINIVRPSESTHPVIFWDDTEITDGVVLDSKINLFGCQSSAAEFGCHRWRERGSLNDAAALEKQETINTWWYSTILNTTFIANIPVHHEVQLSFHPELLVKGDTTVCRGDSLNFYVYNESTHFNNSLYTYEWTFNNSPLPSDIRAQRQQIMNPSQVIVKATDRALGCISSDTLNILVVDPVTLRGNVINPPCNSSTGSIEVEMLTGPPNKEFFWQQFPAHKTGILNDLPPGTYNLRAYDVKYPHCGAEASYTIVELDGIRIDTIITTNTNCHQTSGSAQVYMVDMTRTFEYSWNGGAFAGNSSLNNLSPGDHNVIVRDPATGCTDSRAFIINTENSEISVRSENEVCGNGQGLIELTINTFISDFTIAWNGVTTNQTSRNNLSSGTYNIQVSSAQYPSCGFNTTVQIINVDRKLIIEDLRVQPADCRTNNGSAEIIMAPGSYLYSWNNGAYASNNTINNLSAGSYSVSIRETTSLCVADTTFIIPPVVTDLSVSKKDEICGSGNGNIDIATSNPDYEVIWNDGDPSTFNRSGLSSGDYSFIVRDRNNHTCQIQQTVTIRDSVYTLHADFTYHLINPDSAGKAHVGFTNISPVYTWSVWNFGDGKFSSENHPEHFFNQDTEYTVVLQITDSLGCPGEVRKRISPYRILNPNCTKIALPNVFSPNDDGHNDDLGLLGEAPFVELKIFNRWGEVIFRTFSVENRWDGFYRGERAPVGVYPYILDWSCPDESGNLYRFHKVGDITIVR